ncbi:MAG: type II secretion system GspH family protein [Puniceicoccales bacterium]|jgi:prepilin-type N-terminal cleavage/methylation domain-containing protein|nr:type II secretion system GspH family protein [Puniceicoccales bacterium]
MNILNKLNKRNRGFTLIEILIVLVILAGIVAMLTKGTIGGRNAARVNQMKLDMSGRIATAVIARAAVLGKVPDAKNDLTTVYLGTDLTDPFGGTYQFDSDDKNKKVTIKPQSGGEAAKLGVPPVVVDLTPYVP